MPRRILEGKVVSDKQDKTISVVVERRVMHPIYKKYMKKTSKFSAHDENNTVKMGEVVQIIECAPISKNKRFTLYTSEEAASVKSAKAEVKKETAVAKKAPAKKAVAKKETVKKTPAKKAVAKKDDK